MWPNEPETPYCGNSLKNLPAWHATACDPCTSTAPATFLWQFAEQTACSLTVNIDMDEGTLTPYSLYLTSRP